MILDVAAVRASELRALRWDIVDVVRGLLHVRRAKSGSRRRNRWEATSCGHRLAFRIKALAEAYNVLCHSGNGAVAPKRAIGFAQEATMLKRVAAGATALSVTNCLGAGPSAGRASA
jgi:integrase